MEHFRSELSIGESRYDQLITPHSQCLIVYMHRQTGRVWDRSVTRVPHFRSPGDTCLNPFPVFHLHRRTLLLRNCETHVMPVTQIIFLSQRLLN